MGLANEQKDTDLDQRWWIDRALKTFHEIDVFPPKCMCEETWAQAIQIRSALEEVWGEDHMPLTSTYPSRMSLGIFYQPKIYFLKSLQTAGIRYRIEACGDDGEDVEDLVDKYNLVPHASSSAHR